MYNNIYVPVTLVVTAYNEEDIIEEKITNCLSLKYPSALIKFIFITDGSGDNTSSIIKKKPSDSSPAQRSTPRETGGYEQGNRSCRNRNCDIQRRKYNVE